MKQKKIFSLVLVLCSLILIGCEHLPNSSEANVDESNGWSDAANDVNLVFSTSNNNVIGQAASNGGSSIYSNVYDVVYGNNKFVAVGISGQIAYSTDGSNWIKSQNNGFRLNDSDVKGITFGNGRFVAFGSRGNVVSNGKISTWWDIVYSSNGSSWVRADTSSFNVAISNIVYGGGKFWAVSESGKIASSSDGSSWMPITDSTLNGISFSSVAYGAGKYIAVSSSGKMGVSTDGINWTVVISGSFGNITYLKDKYIAWGNGNFATSTDGVTWQLLVNTSFDGIVYGAGKFVSWSGRNIKLSKDNCITWVQVDSTFNEAINKISYGNGVFSAVGGKFGHIAYTNKQE